MVINASPMSRWEAVCVWMTTTDLTFSDFQAKHHKCHTLPQYNTAQHTSDHSLHGTTISHWDWLTRWATKTNRNEYIWWVCL